MALFEKLLDNPDILGRMLESLPSGQKKDTLLSLRNVSKRVASRAPAYLLHLMKFVDDDHFDGVLNVGDTFHMLSKGGDVSTRDEERMLRAAIAYAFLNENITITIRSDVRTTDLDVVADELQGARQDFAAIGFGIIMLDIYIDGARALRALHSHSNIRKALRSSSGIRMTVSLKTPLDADQFDIATLLAIISDLSEECTNLKVIFKHLATDTKLMVYISDFIALFARSLNTFALLGIPCSLQPPLPANTRSDTILVAPAMTFLSVVDQNTRSFIHSIRGIRSMFPNLSVLHLGCHHIGDLADLSNMRNLTRLKVALSGQEAVRDSLHAVMPTLSRLNDLFVAPEYGEFFEIKNLPPRLQNIFVRNDATNLEEYMSSSNSTALKNAKDISITFDIFGSIGIWNVLRRHPCMNTLQNLRLCNSRCTTIPLDVLCEMPRLRSLTVSDRELRSFDIPETHKVSNLRELSIIHSPQFESSFEFAARMMPRLRYLDVRFTNVNMVSDFLLKTLRVFRYEGTPLVHRFWNPNGNA